MKFFTPELLVRFRSPDPEVADKATEEWEQAIRRYRRHLTKIEPQLPESVRLFRARHCLHDADVFGPARLAIPALPWSVNDVVLVAQNENTLVPEDLHTLMFLRYEVVKEPVVTIPVPSDAFHEGQPVWLYDEFSLVAPAVFSHEVLLSNGRVVELLFRDFQVHVARLMTPYKNLNLHQATQTKTASA